MQVLFCLEVPCMRRGGQMPGQESRTGGSQPQDSGVAGGCGKGWELLRWRSVESYGPHEPLHWGQTGGEESREEFRCFQK